MNEYTLGLAEGVKLICLTATGYNNVDLEYTKKRGITVTNVAGYSTYSVAQHTFAMLFYLMEKLPYYDSFVKNGEYVGYPIFCNITNVFHELCGMTWGIIGLGAIGRQVGRLAREFGCKVVYYSTSGNNNSDEFKRVELDELLSMSDVVSIHAPLNAATNNLMNKAAFGKMKNSAILINVGRGPIVNEADLAEALKDGQIAAAGLDVLCVEPMEKDNPLLAIKDSGRLFITPHIAWGTYEARKRLLCEVADNIRAFCNGEKRNVVE
jgi:glycerate dehydrogenase